MLSRTPLKATYLSHIYQLKNPKINTEITPTVIFRSLIWRENFHPALKTSQKAKRKKKQARKSVGSLTTCSCKSSFPASSWCPPFRQPQRAMPASIPTLLRHVHPRSHAHAWKRQDLGSVSSWYFMACSSLKRKARRSCIWSRLTFQAEGAEGGKLILRRGGSAFLLRHPAAAAVAPWSTPLAPQTLPEQEGAGVEKGKHHGHRQSLLCM